MRHHRMLWVFCRSCGHAQHVHPWAFVQTLGENMALAELARKCRCDRCRDRQAAIILSAISSGQR